jgi:parvulin-like peptidyl-prolyl isomerase
MSPTRRRSKDSAVNRHAFAHQAKRRLAPLSALLVLLSISPAPAVTSQPGDLVAQMGQLHFTAGDLKDFLQTLSPDIRRQALADPLAMERLIQGEVARRAILNEATAKKWQSRPAVAKEINAARDSIVLRNYLTAVTDLPASYPSESDIKAAYTLNPDKFLVPRQYRLEQIFITSPPGDKNAAAALKTAKDLSAKAHMRGVRFEDLARQNSQHKATAEKGGDTGWLMESQLRPAILSKIAGMAKGEISEPIRGDQGWHIVRLMDTKPATTRPLAEVRALIVTSLRQEKQQNDQLQYVKRMVDKTPVRLNQANLRTALEAAR